MYSTLLTLALLFGIISAQSPNPEVSTKYGWVRGSAFTIRNVSVDEFYGVPFARPPLGSLRFDKPQEVASWAPEYLDATIMRDHCSQPNQWVHYSEDCLYLNIWRPSGRSANAEKMPVFFYIHGG